MIFLILGLNGFLHFIPIANMPEGAIVFFRALAKTGCMLEHPVHLVRTAAEEGCHPVEALTDGSTAIEL